jgi:hypothetical protein
MPSEQQKSSLVDEKRSRKPRTAKRGGLWVNDTELIEMLNVPDNVARPAFRMLDANPNGGFPQKKQKLWSNKRYLPAVLAYFDHTYISPQFLKSATVNYR